MDSTHGVYPSATVLVVDDTPDNLMLIAELLKDKYRVKAANSGEKALRLLQADPLPDLILLDIMMPGTLNGLEVCRQIKADHATRFTKVILLTARVQAGDREAGMAAGACAVGGQLILYALAPRIYPAQVRATGVGVAVAVGRLGSMSGPLLAGQLLAAGAGVSGLLLAVSPLVAVAAISAATLLSQDRHGFRRVS